MSFFWDNVEENLDKITSKVLIIACNQDLYFPSELDAFPMFDMIDDVEERGGQDDAPPHDAETERVSLPIIQAYKYARDCSIKEPKDTAGMSDICHKKWLWWHGVHEHGDLWGDVP